VADFKARTNEQGLDEQATNDSKQRQMQIAKPNEQGLDEQATNDSKLRQMQAASALDGHHAISKFHD